MTKETKTFKFFYDEKCTVWCRTTFDVEADSIESARDAAISFVESGEVTDLPWETLTDTCEVIDIADNDAATQELYSAHESDYTPIYDNYQGVRIEKNKNKDNK